MAKCMSRALVRMTPARREELARARALADRLFIAHPKPSADDIARARARLARRPGNGLFISAKDKRRLRAWTLRAYGNGRKAPCIWCGRMLYVATLTLDRLICGNDGGKYNQRNIAPACEHCNTSRADTPYHPFACASACPITRAA